MSPLNGMKEATLAQIAGGQCGKGCSASTSESARQCAAPAALFRLAQTGCERVGKRRKWEKQCVRPRLPGGENCTNSAKILRADHLAAMQYGRGRFTAQRKEPGARRASTVIVASPSVVQCAPQIAIAWIGAKRRWRDALRTRGVVSG